MQVMPDELALMPCGEPEPPLTYRPKITLIAAHLAANPDDRRILREWARHVAVSERTPNRLIIQERG